MSLSECHLGDPTSGRMPYSEVHPVGVMGQCRGTGVRPMVPIGSAEAAFFSPAMSEAFTMAHDDLATSCMSRAHASSAGSSSSMLSTFPARSLSSCRSATMMGLPGLSPSGGGLVKSTSSLFDPLQIPFSAATVTGLSLRFRPDPEQVYHIKVERPGRDPYYIFRRYEEWMRMLDFLHEELPGLALPPLPCKPAKLLRTFLRHHVDPAAVPTEAASQPGSALGRKDQIFAVQRLDHFLALLIRDHADRLAGSHTFVTFFRQTGEDRLDAAFYAKLSAIGCHDFLADYLCF